MAIIAKYKFNSSLCADYLPIFNDEFTGYTKTDVNNGDGTITRTISHDTLKPTYMRFGGTFGNPTDREKSLIEVMECDTSEVTNMGNMFQSCHSLISLNVSSFNTSKATNMGYMFNDCKLLTSLDLSNFDTSKVTNFDSIFENCTSLATINVSSWDTSKVTNMAYMFNNCQSLISLEVSNFNTSNVTVMNKMFSNCSKLTSLDISNFDTSKVTNMNWMFSNCSKLTSLDISNFDTSNVTAMSGMFNGCSSLTSLNVSNFNTNKVQYMDNMFNGCSSLTSLDLSSFDTSKVTDMQNMFNGCSSLTSLDVSNFDTSKVTNMTNMFNNCPSSSIGLLYATSSTINSLVTALGTSVARNIYYTDAPLDELTVQDNITYKKYEFAKATFPYTLNKLPNGVADYIDVVNKVHVQRVGKVVLDGRENWTKQHNITDYTLFYYILPTLPKNTSIRLDCMICDKINVENYQNLQAQSREFITIRNGETKQLLLNLSNYKASDVSAIQTYLASNPITVLYELATPIYTPLTEEEIAQLPLSAYADGCVNLSSDQLTPSFEFRMKASNRYQVDMLETGYYYLNAPVGNVKLGTANVDVQQMPCIVKVDNVGTGDNGYRLGLGGEITDTTQITLAKLPSHRIPTSFTQGMRCGTDFGYWEGIKVATGKQLYVNETNKLDFTPIELNRIEYNNTIVEDEFDIAIGKFTKRIGKYTIDGNSNLWEYSVAQFETATHMSFCCSSIPNFKKGGRCIGFLGIKQGLPNVTNSIECWDNLGVSDSLYFRLRKDRYSHYGNGVDGVKAYFNANPTTIYYELQVPEISYVNLSSNQVKTVANSTLLQSLKADTTYLNPQVKPSHLTYPVPSLVGNRTYTVVHNRKNISGSTKPIELNLGGTVVQLNDASSKTLVTTPSTLAHSNLIFIGGESTVDHIMVLDGDWTNKPIEYFENMKGHDTDAIITIIGDSKIDDVAEQYLW